MKLSFVTRNWGLLSALIIPAILASSYRAKAECGSNRYPCNDTGKHVATDTANFLSQAQLVPYRYGEKLAGFKVMSLEGGSIWEKLGLQAGDVLQSFNGKPLSSIGASQELFVTLGQSASQDLVIEVLRAGKKVTLRYKIEGGDKK